MVIITSPGYLNLAPNTCFTYIVVVTNESCHLSCCVASLKHPANVAPYLSTKTGAVRLMNAHSEQPTNVFILLHVLIRWSHDQRKSVVSILKTFNRFSEVVPFEHKPTQLSAAHQTGVIKPRPYWRCHGGGPSGT